MIQLKHDTIKAHIVRRLIQATEILFGSCSGVCLGNVTVRTPLSIDALISSGYGVQVSTLLAEIECTHNVP